jgi:tetratricopeptide (TPR) repeat protein/tRNA A-37 threonylcarbamoyl transferase component Bud32
LGEIFGANDTELRRRVALKQMQHGHAQNSSSRERFVAEAEITGNLEHPGIVPVYGLGTGPDGLPYYAMRFVKGETLQAAIHRFHSGLDADFAGREFRWLLRRFMDACNPVGYAHSRGILHRDLKPSNIMLGPFGETLVMDWGVAKVVSALEPKGTISDDPTPESYDSNAYGGLRNGLVTLDGETVGTPAFMSPEQAAGRLDSLGPGSDVYSLGATLYVLLTDTRPYSGESDQVLRDVQQGRFPRPRTIKPALPMALEAICLRAMALDPRKRYDTALALAEDIDRWLSDEPVTAWKEPWLDRAGRWVRRHKPFVAGSAAAASVALLALGLAVPVLSMAWGNESVARRNEQRLRILATQKAEEALELQKVADRSSDIARRERAAAVLSETKANEEKDRAQKALEFLVAAFRKPDPALDGHSLKVVDLLDRAVREVNQSFHDQPLMEATLLAAIGETFGGLGMPEKSLPVLERAAALRSGTLGEEHPDTVRARHNLAAALEDSGQFDQAIVLLEQTLARRKARADADPSDLIESLNDLAVAYWESGQASRAIPLYESALEKVRARLGDDHADTLTIMDNLAVAYSAVGQAGRAVSLHETVLRRFEATLGEHHLTTLVAMNNLARALEAGHKPNESIELYEKTIPLLREKLGDDHPIVMTAMGGLARAYNAAGRRAEAIGLFENVLAKRRAKLGDQHPDTLMNLFDLASAYSGDNQPKKGSALAREFLDRTARLGNRLPTKIRQTVSRAQKLRDSLAERLKFVSP